jgi:hypothetical protein
MPQTWVSGGRAGKVERLKAMLVIEKQDEENLVSNHSQLQQNLAHHTKVQQQAQNANNYKAQLAQQQQRVFQQVVAAVPKTPEYTHAAAAQQLAKLSEQAETSTLQQMQNVDRIVASAANMLGACHRKLADAARSNCRAQEHGRRAVDYEHRAQRGGCCDEEGAAAAARMAAAQVRLERSNERREARKRDQILVSLRAEAQAAGQTLGQAFAAVPARVRQQYPQLSAPIGQVVLPQLKGGGLAGEVVGLVTSLMHIAGAGTTDLSNSNQVMAVRDINSNQQILAQCQAIANQQLSCVRALVAAVQHAITQQQQMSDQMQQAMASEDQRVFGMVRMVVCAAVCAAAPERQLLAPGAGLQVNFGGQFIAEACMESVCPASSAGRCGPQCLLCGGKGGQAMDEVPTAAAVMVPLALAH